MSVSVYVAGTGKFVTAEMVQTLVDLGFKLSLSHKRAGFSPCTMSKEAPLIVQPVVLSAFGRALVSAPNMTSSLTCMSAQMETCVIMRQFVKHVYVLGLSCRMWSAETAMQGGPCSSSS